MFIFNVKEVDVENSSDALRIGRVTKREREREVDGKKKERLNLFFAPCKKYKLFTN